MNAPYKYDIVGSFLRDKEIKQAREDFSLGKINQSQLEEIENKSIENLVNEEKVKRRRKSSRRTFFNCL